MECSKIVLKSKYIEVNDRLLNEDDVMDIIIMCISNNVSVVLMNENVLLDEFIDLKTGLAGLVLQKFINYHIRVSAVITKDIQGRFKELSYELNKTNNFRIFNNRIDAESWILDIK